MDDGACVLCLRQVPGRLLTWHHVVPKSRGGTAEDRVAMCKPCHRQVHAVFTNRRLERELDTVEKLAAAPELAAFLGWIRKQKPHRVFQTRESKNKGR